MSVYVIREKQWTESLSKAFTEYKIYAPTKRSKLPDYELIDEKRFSEISYDCILPVLPLKAFFFPIKENVVKEPETVKRIIIGVRNCDLAALNLLDAVFLDEEFLDIHYKTRRDNTILIGTDCLNIKDTCHCTTYGLEPYPQSNFDLSISPAGEMFYLTVNTARGKDLLQELNLGDLKEIEDLPENVLEKRAEISGRVSAQNSELPDLEGTKEAILNTDDEFWREYASKCVSCGACSVICPTCHCFLLIDREKFEKVKNWDACQYPSFEKVAAGENPLKKLYKRLRNRYECKYIHKPGMFDVLACTGCGRCIEACIGKINKNEIIIAARKRNEYAGK